MVYEDISMFPCLHKSNWRRLNNRWGSKTGKMPGALEAPTVIQIASIIIWQIILSCRIKIKIIFLVLFLIWVSIVAILSLWRVRFYCLSLIPFIYLKKVFFESNVDYKTNKRLEKVIHLRVQVTLNITAIKKSSTNEAGNLET